MKLLLISIPKAGTHMVNQATTRRQFDNLPWGSMIYIPTPSELTLEGIYNHEEILARTHVPYHPLYELAIRETGTRAIFLYRDPRDLLVSYYEWVKKLGHRGESIPGLIKEVSIFLDSEDPIMEMLKFWGEHIRRYIPWLFVPDLLSIKYEELLIQKVETCDKIIAHWGAAPFGTAIEMAGRIKPSTSTTFRKGIIGDWVNYFEPRHEEEFIKVLGKTMEVLGYEI